MNDQPSGPRVSLDDPRVRFAAERTLLAWMRTGLALMGFGFVVARFGLFLREIAVAGQFVAPSHSTGWSLWIGTGLIALGVIATLRAALEYYRFVRRTERGQLYMPRTTSLAIAVGSILAALGAMMAAYLILVSLLPLL